MRNRSLLFQFAKYAKIEKNAKSKSLFQFAKYAKLIEKFIQTFCLCKNIKINLSNKIIEISI
jgi:hypothetical protein